jgi:hypothetical protein
MRKRIHLFLRVFKFYIIIIIKVIFLSVVREFNEFLFIYLFLEKNVRLRKLVIFRVDFLLHIMNI